MRAALCSLVLRVDMKVGVSGCLPRGDSDNKTRFQAENDVFFSETFTWVSRFNEIVSSNI